MIRAATAAAIALGLLGCNAMASPGPPAPARSAMHTGGTLPPRPVLAAMPSFDGIGPLRFGMTPPQMRKAWGRPLHGRAPAGDPQACWYLTPDGHERGVKFMIEANRFVRIDVQSRRRTAPGGGRTGMPASRIEELYAGRVTAAPGKYDPAARILSVSSPRHPGAKLIFELDPAGNVASWRIGVTPQVDYVEGCG